MRRNIFDPNSSEPFKISRSKIDLFLECRRCFYLDQRLGVKRPDMPGFSLNTAVDELLKREFDLLRQNGQAHELMRRYKIDAVPFKHAELDAWRQNFVGKQYHHKPTNLIIFGAVDDLWINLKEELIVVDYKATSTSKEISLDDEFKQGYKHQMEIYQWIFRKSGFKICDIGYFIFANATKDRPNFDGRLEFDLSIIAYRGDSSWIEPAVFEIKKTLESAAIPQESKTCKYCAYRNQASLAIK